MVIVTAGTLAVLSDAALGGLIDFHQAVKHLTQHTEFRHTRALIERVIAEQRRRKSDDTVS